MARTIVLHTKVQMSTIVTRQAKQTSVIQVQSTKERAVCYAELCKALADHTLGNTACVTALMLRLDLYRFCVQSWSVGRRSVLIRGTSTLTLAHYIILNLQAINQVSKPCSRLSSSPNQLREASNKGGPAQGGYVMMCMWLMVGSSSTRTKLHCVRAMQQLNGT